MTATEILDSLKESGVFVKAQGMWLIIDAPQGVLTPELKAALSESIAEILALLSTRSGSKPEPCCPICGCPLKVEEHAGGIFLECPREHFAATRPKGWQPPTESK